MVPKWFPKRAQKIPKRYRKQIDRLTKIRWYERQPQNDKSDKMKRDKQAKKQ